MEVWIETPISTANDGCLEAFVKRHDTGAKELWILDLTRSGLDVRLWLRLNEKSVFDLDDIKKKSDKIVYDYQEFRKGFLAALELQEKQNARS